jgi:hypothetical protein
MNELIAWTDYCRNTQNLPWRKNEPLTNYLHEWIVGINRKSFLTNTDYLAWTISYLEKKILTDYSGKKHEQIFAMNGFGYLNYEHF